MNYLDATVTQLFSGSQWRGERALCFPTEGGAPGPLGGPPRVLPVVLRTCVRLTTCTPCAHHVHTASSCRPRPIKCGGGAPDRAASPGLLDAGVRPMLKQVGPGEGHVSGSCPPPTPATLIAPWWLVGGSIHSLTHDLSTRWAAHSLTRSLADLLARRPFLR